MQSLCTVEFFEKQPPETYGIKLDTIENDKSNEALISTLIFYIFKIFTSTLT